MLSELDMGNGYQQVPLHESSHCIFQLHKGLHRMKRLFFGPTNSTGIFQHEVSKAFAGVQGCITIHDNIICYGRDVEEHNTNLRAIFARGSHPEAEQVHHLCHRNQVVWSYLFWQWCVS